MIKIIHNKNETELKKFILESLSYSNSSGFREVDSLIDYISNTLEGLSETVSILYEKGVLNISDIERITQKQNLKTKG